MSPSPLPPPGNAAARLVVSLTLLLGAGLLVTFHVEPFRDVRIGAAYAVPALLLLGVLSAGWLASLGSAPVPRLLFLAGVLYAAGGAAFDMVATVKHSPDLDREQNPIARALLDSGHSVEFVYRYAALGQGLWVAFICLLWLGLLRHRAALVETVRGQSGALAFLKAATGGAELTYRQWLLPLHARELPWAFHLAWLLTTALLATSADRWLLGLEWFGVAPHGWRWWVGGAALVAGWTVYLAWLWRARRDY